MLLEVAGKSCGGAGITGFKAFVASVIVSCC
jgi:hypothetical protein